MSNYDSYPPDRVNSGGYVQPQQVPVAQTGAQPQQVARPGDKRTRRMRSTQGAAHYGNGHKGKRGSGVDKMSYHDRKTDAPVFLQKTYEMISSCQPKIASWSEDGTMFIIKDQKVFEKEVIPQFFDHNKFTSFARQLNFYGFRKMQTRAIFKDEINKDTAKWVTFFNEKFQRGKKELLKEIQRSTKGGHGGNQDQQKEINALKEKVLSLEHINSDMNIRIATLETHVQQFLSYNSFQMPSQSYNTQPYAERAAESDPTSYINDSVNDSDSYPIVPIPYEQDRIASNGSSYAERALRPVDEDSSSRGGRATLAPHPKVKYLPDETVLPTAPRPSLDKLDPNFMRGWSKYGLDDNGSSTRSLGVNGMSQFDKQLFTTTMSGPDPVQVRQSASGFARQLSDSVEKLNLDDFPPLESKH